MVSACNKPWNRRYYLVVHPLTKIQRSFLRFSALATVFSSIFEYTNLDPCIGQAARKIAEEQSTAAPMNTNPGKNNRAGMANTRIHASKRKSQLCNTTSLVPRRDQYKFALRSEDLKGSISRGRYGSLEMSIPKSWSKRRKEFVLAASVVVVARASICGGMNLTPFAMASEKTGFSSLAGGALVIFVS